MISFNDQLPPTFNVARYFVEKNVDSGAGAKVAFYHQDQTLTYEQVYRSVRQTAGLIQDLGVDREHRVAILLPDSPELVFTFWGAVWAGCVAVPINTSCAVDEVRHILADCRARLLVTTELWYERLTPLRLPLLRQILRVDGRPDLLELLGRAPAELSAADTCRDEPAFWLYTSGSTGRPKGVVHAHCGMVVCAELYAKRTLGLGADDINYSTAKIPFAYGLGSTLYMPSAVGGSAVLTEAGNAFDIIADIHRYRPTILWGTPAVYAGLLALSEIAPLDVSSIRLCVSAAERLPEPIWHSFRRSYGLEICEGAGATEALHIFLSNRPGTCRPGTAGLPVPGYQVRTVGPGGRSLPPGHTGELEVAGESLMLGYWALQRESQAVLHGGALRTGDRCVADAEGFFRLLGRTDERFKVGGLWVAPAEVEDTLRGHPDVLDCAVVPECPDPRGLPAVAAYIEPKPGHGPADALAEDVRRFAMGRLPRIKVPRVVRLIEALPRTATGKVDRKRLQRLDVSGRKQ